MRQHCCTCIYCFAVATLLSVVGCGIPGGVEEADAGAVVSATTAAEVPLAGPVLTARTRRLAESKTFATFADQAGLGDTVRIGVARTLALHSLNDASIQKTAASPEAKIAMQRQLLGNTAAYVRYQLTDAAWDAFVKSGLLPGVESLDLGEARQP